MAFIAYFVHTGDEEALTRAHAGDTKEEATNAAYDELVGFVQDSVGGRLEAGRAIHADLTEGNIDLRCNELA